MHQHPKTKTTAARANHPKQAQDNAWKTRAVTLHTTFVRELVEAHDFCPWATSARIAGRSQIRAVFANAIDDFFETTIKNEEHQHIEVWQLVVPDADYKAMAWRAYVAELEQRLRKVGHDLPWAFAAFHPEHPGRPQSIGGVIGMLRRSPLPAIQLVRLDVLDRVREKAAAQVENLPQYNHQTMQRWLSHTPKREEHAKWLQQGKKLAAEIQNARARNEPQTHDA